MVEDDDEIGVFHGLEPVCDGDNGNVIMQCSKTFGDCLFGYAVECGSGFVEDKNTWVP